MKTIKNCSRSPEAKIDCNSILIFTIVTLWVSFLVVPASAQNGMATSDSSGKQAVVTPSPQEHAGTPAAKTQSENTPKPDDQRPTLTSDGTAIPSKPSISLSEPSGLTFGDRF